MIIIATPGDRGTVDLETARSLIQVWISQLRKVNQSSLSVGLNITLSGKSYRPESAQLISNFFTSIEYFNPCLATYAKKLDLSDVIASLSTQDGFQVLISFGKAFIHSLVLSLLRMTNHYC